MPRAISMYSGIGGMDLAAEAAGFKTDVVCEVDEFCRQYLSYYWPEAYQYDSDEKVTEESLRALGIEPGTIDLLYGGPPCQAASIAGRRLGEADSRWRWPEYLRVAHFLRPTWVVAENPRGLLSLRNGIPFRAIENALTNMGYRVGWSVYGASAFNAPHKRERVFIIAKLADSGSGGPQRPGAAGSMGSAESGTEGAGYQRQWVRDTALGQGGAGGVVDPTVAGLPFRRDSRYALRLQHETAERAGTDQRGELGDSQSVGGQDQQKSPDQSDRPLVGTIPGADGRAIERRVAEGIPDPGRTDATGGEDIRRGPEDVADVTRLGCGEGWSESEGVQGGLDAALGSCATPGPFDLSWVRERPVGDTEEQSIWSRLRESGARGFGRVRPCHTDGQDAGLDRAEDGDNQAREPEPSVGSGVAGSSSRLPGDTDNAVQEAAQAAHYQGARPIWQPGHAWPSRPGQPQHPWEPPRLIVSGPFRVSRLKGLGNLCCPDQFYAVADAIARSLRGEL